ncbi:unnamed protein product, partial [Adineta steineri]
MAFRSQLFGVPLPQLESVEKVQEKLKENKLVLILFNTNYPKEHSIESKFKSWRTTYESKNDLHIYKCVISVLENPLKKEYQIKKLPTFIFFQNGQPIGRLEDAENVVPPVNNVEEVNPNTEKP